MTKLSEIDLNEKLSEYIDCCHNFYSISKYSPINWISKAAQTYIEKQFKMIKDNDTHISRITLMDSFRFENYFNDSIKKFENIIDRYLTKVSIVSRQKILNNMSGTIIIEVLNIFEKIHNPYESAFFLETKYEDKCKGLLRDYDEVLIYDSDRAIGINVKNDGQYEYYPYKDKREIKNIISEWNNTLVKIEGFKESLDEYRNRLLKKYEIVFNPEELTVPYRNFFIDEETVEIVKRNFKQQSK